MYAPAVNSIFFFQLNIYLYYIGPGKNTGNSPLNMFVGATLPRHVVTYPACWCPRIPNTPMLCTVSKLVPDVQAKAVN